MECEKHPQTECKDCIREEIRELENKVEELKRKLLIIPVVSPQQN